MPKKHFPGWNLHLLETPAEIAQVEELQRLVWPGSDTDIVPAHLLLASVHNGGLAIGAYIEPSRGSRQIHGDSVPFDPDNPPILAGFVFGFPGFYETPDGPRLKHHSHLLGIHPDFRNHGIGFALKRAQWQMVRRQGIDRITWTYDPLQSRNANLNIAHLGAVCNTYLRDFYGDMRDELNIGLPSDRFQVDWWVYSKRVDRRLSRRSRPRLVLSDFIRAGTEILNPLKSPSIVSSDLAPILLLEIPSDIAAIKNADPSLAHQWRIGTRILFENLFADGYLITDYVYELSDTPRSFYVLTHGEATL